MIPKSVCMAQTAKAPGESPGPFCGAPCMGNNLAVEVRYALGSRER